MSRKVDAMTSKKPEPLLTQAPGKFCPICGKRSYSLRGIHPQCAVQQADAPRQAVLAEEKRERVKAEAAQRLSAANS